MNSSLAIPNHERGGPGGPAEPRSPPRDASTPFSQQALPRRSHSDRSSYSRPSYYSGRENELPRPPPPPPPSRLLPEQFAEARRQTIMALDRKRRLTASASDNGRRRTTTGASTNRDNRYHPTPVRQHSNSHGSAGGSVRAAEVIDLTSSSPPAERSHPPPRPSPQRSSNSPRGYVVPRWQPDSEASECPICHRQFTLWFRRHHCRKCGRVVCNECSPHRITIPKQYIVQPPGYEEDPLQPLTVDLTRVDENDDSYGRLANISRRLNPALGGGEKVRLCNPCVPDPQPESQALFEQLSRAQLQHSSGLSSFPDLPPFPPDAPQRRSSHNNRVQDQPPHPGTRVHLDVTSDNDDSGSSPEAYTSASRQHIMALAASSRPYPAFGPAHSRYHSLDTNHGSLPPVAPFSHRIRVSSGSQQFGASGTTLPQHLSDHQQSSSTSAIHRPQRPRIREEDICPVCRGALPPKGPDGDETDRENHIMACINQHDTSAASPASRQRTQPQLNSAQANLSTSLPAPQIMSGLRPSSSTPPARVVSTQMLRFTATEKDCIAVSVPGEEEPQPQECSICMVEYEVGEQLARLECWCKFHEECIIEWFGRKRECPVHKIS